MMSALYLQYLTVLSLLSYVLIQYIFQRIRNLPPSPFPTLPLIGHLHLLLKKPLHRTLAKLSDQYGQVLFLKLGSRNALLVASPSVAEECFTKNDIVFSNHPRLLAGKYLGYNYTSMIWAPYGDHWRNLRRISSLEILSSHRLQIFSHIRVDEVRTLTHQLSRLSAEDPGERAVELKSKLFEFAFNVMLRTMAGKRYYGEDVSNAEEAKRFQEIVSQTSRLVGAPFIGDFLPFIQWFGLSKRIEKSLMILQEKRDRFMQDLIEEQRGLDLCDSGSSPSTGEKKKKNMIDILLSLQKTEPEYYTDQTIKSLVLVLLQAGTDTTANTMEWAMSHLLNNPKILKKAQVEIDNYTSKNRLVDESDVLELPYLQCIIKETLRLHPPPLLPLESSEECIVAGYNIPRGTMLLVNAWSIQHDPEIWEDPGEFRPERFEGPEGNRDGLRFMFMPFGSGRRGCPGESLAMRMVGLVMASLIQCFDWERVGKEKVDMTERSGVTVAKAIALTARCRPRPIVENLVSET